MAKEGTAGQLAAIRYVAEHVRLAAFYSHHGILAVTKKLFRSSSDPNIASFKTKGMHEISQLSCQNLSSYLICHLGHPSKSPIYCTSYQANLVSLKWVCFNPVNLKGFQRESFREVILIYMILPGLVARIRVYLV